MLKSDHVHVCIVSCARYGEAVISHPEILKNESVQKCFTAFTNAENKLPAMKRSVLPIDIDKAPETIEYIEFDIDKAMQKWEVAVENSTTPASKRQAQNCHDACSRDAS